MPDGSSVNVRVAVRARPMSGSETARGSLACVKMGENGRVAIENPKGRSVRGGRGGAVEREGFKRLF